MDVRRAHLTTSCRALLLCSSVLLCACQDPPSPPSGAQDLASPAGADLRAEPTADLAAQPDLAPYPDPLPGAGAVEKVLGGFLFTEGPYWLADRGVLLFSDVQGNRVVELKPPAESKTYRMPSNNTNGLGRDRGGRLLFCEHSGRRLARQEADGSIVALAERWEGKRLSSPNDVITRSDGNIYFTDPPYGIPAGQMQELNFQGLFRLDPGGQLSLVDSGMNRPNGVALSPDERTLYAVDTSSGQIRRYALDPGGAPQPQGPLATTGGGGDGIAVDDAGNLYVAASAGVRVFSAAGKDLGTLKVPEVPANVGFGDGDRRTLYITARTSLYKARMPIAGLP